MARPKKANQLELKEKLFTLKLGSVQVPYIEDGKGAWKTVTQGNWNLADQQSLFKFWREELFANFDDDKKDLAIKAKMNKLFIVPVEETVEEENGAE